MKAGVLALQGDFREHAAMFAEAGATPVLVRTPEELATVDCLAIPGGESTTISKLARRFELVEPNIVFHTHHRQLTFAPILSCRGFPRRTALSRSGNDPEFS